jgi:hypothetical protein
MSWKGTKPSRVEGDDISRSMSGLVGSGIIDFLLTMPIPRREQALKHLRTTSGILTERQWIEDRQRKAESATQETPLRDV